MVKTKPTVLFKKKNILLIMVFLIGCFVCACGKEKSVVGETLVEDTEEVSSTEETKSAEEEAAEQWEKGYGLPVDEQEEKEAANDCKKMMELIFDIYKDADKGTASNVVLNDETVLEMQKRLMETGCPVSTLVTYSNMENYESVDRFLEECTDGKSGSVVIYGVYGMTITSRECPIFPIPESKNGSTRRKGGSVMSYVCRSRRKSVKSWTEAVCSE